MRCCPWMRSGEGGKGIGQIRAFWEVVTKLGLGDLGLRGGSYTWCNMREGSNALGRD